MHLIDPQKTLLGLLSIDVHFILFYMNPLPLLYSVSIKRRAEMALFPDTVVADVVNKILITFFIFGNLTSTLLSHIYFSVLDKLFVSFFCSDAQYFIP